MAEFRDSIDIAATPETVSPSSEPAQTPGRMTGGRSQTDKPPPQRRQERRRIK